jgi:hypothetical protein
MRFPSWEQHPDSSRECMLFRKAVRYILWLSNATGIFSTCRKNSFQELPLKFITLTRPDTFMSHWQTETELDRVNDGRKILKSLFWHGILSQAPGHSTYNYEAADTKRSKTCCFMQGQRQGGFHCHVQGISKRAQPMFVTKWILLFIPAKYMASPFNSAVWTRDTFCVGLAKLFSLNSLNSFRKTSRSCTLSLVHIHGRWKRVNTSNSRHWYFSCLQ